MLDSGTTLKTFSPYAIPYQSKVVELIRKNWDYDKGTPEILLSGSYGSAKSILMAHLAVTHCLFFPKSRACLARKGMPDLKATIYKEIIEHIDEDLVEGKDYWLNTSSGGVTFSNGSEVISRSWSDKKYNKGRSLKLSFLAFEELTENNEEDKQAFMTLKARLRRLPHVKENVLIAATNPDSPDHWVYKYFFDDSKETRFVFKSVTTDNPFLDPQYINQLKNDLDPLSARRYIHGEWVSLHKERIYYNYEKERNYIDEAYVINPQYPIDLMHDFNIGKGKPMSAAVGQYINGVAHVFGSFHVEGARTEDIMNEIHNKMPFNKAYKYRIFGDAAGGSNDTRSKVTDWHIIQMYLKNLGIAFDYKVPRANPPIRRRHNEVNAHFMNANGKIRYFQYKGTEWIDEAWRLTSLKKGADYSEDDSYPNQHITTAIGYWLDYLVHRSSNHISNSIQL